MRKKDDMVGKKAGYVNERQKENKESEREELN